MGGAYSADVVQVACCACVGQSTVAVEETCGRYDAVLGPGCHFMPWCAGRRVAGYLSLRVQQLDVWCETKSKDNVFVTVVASVQYRALADKAYDAFYRLSNAREQIQSYVFDGLTLKSVSATRWESRIESVKAIRFQCADIQEALLQSLAHCPGFYRPGPEEELSKAMTMYGYEIVQTLIVDIEPDEVVKRAMNDINAAVRLRMAATEKAEAEKIQQVKRAEGDAESKYLAGVGVARQRQAIVEGLKRFVPNEKDVMDMVLVTQYFDTIRDIGATSRSSTVFIPHGPNAVRDMAAQVRDGMLQATGGGGAAPAGRFG